MSAPNPFSLGEKVADVVGRMRAAPKRALRAEPSPPTPLP